MSGAVFDIWRENPQKLWVRTPIPITHAVWNFFMKDAFPKFDLSMHSNERVHHTERWVNRKSMADRGTYAELADGEDSFYWIHAYLPDDSRIGTRKAERGLVYVPQEQARYLDELEEGFKNESKVRQWYETIRFTNENERVNINQAFRAYHTTMVPSVPLSDIRKKLVIALKKEFHFQDERNKFQNLEDGILHPKGKDNTLWHLIATEFLDCVYQELHPFSIRCGQSLGLFDSEISNLSSRIYAKYGDFLLGL